MLGKRNRLIHDTEITISRDAHGPIMSQHVVR